MNQPDRTLRMRKLSEQGTEFDLRDTTPEARIGMMWQLAMDAWAFMGGCNAESRLPRHVVRVVRRES